MVELWGTGGPIATQLIHISEQSLKGKVISSPGMRHLRHPIGMDCSKSLFEA
jgi:hypothetical protein